MHDALYSSFFYFFLLRVLACKSHLEAQFSDSGTTEYISALTAATAPQILLAFVTYFHWSVHA